MLCEVNYSISLKYHRPSLYRRYPHTDLRGTLLSHRVLHPVAAFSRRNSAWSATFLDPVIAVRLSFQHHNRWYYSFHFRTLANHCSFSFLIICLLPLENAATLQVGGSPVMLAPKRSGVATLLYPRVSDALRDIYLASIPQGRYGGS